MRLLVLGGTAPLGHAIARIAVGLGWSVTCLARGSGPVPDGTTLAKADRDVAGALAAVASQTWDAVVDLASQPGHTRQAVAEISSRHWVYVSSASAYAVSAERERDESSPLLEPLDADVMTKLSEYGSAKVACEKAVMAGSDSWTVVRAGLIGGAGDSSGRTGYYAWRFAHPTGDDVLVPPDLEFPCAFIDYEDLAAWIVECCERRVQGAFNATGLTTTLGEVLALSREVAGSSARVRPVPADVLAAEGVSPWKGPKSLPLWIDDPDWRWFATLDTTAAQAAGLRFRPIRDTLAAALEYEESRVGQRPAGLTDDEERSLRATLPS